MLQFLPSFFPEGFLNPSGYCYTLKPELIALHIVSDFLIAFAYYSIPITLLYFLQKPRDLAFNWIFLLFGAFTIACGTTHIMEIWTIFYPYYWVSGFLKALTAGISLCAAIELWILGKSRYWQWILSQTKVIEWDKSGNLLHLTGTNIDVSKSKEAQMEIMTTKIALEDKLQRILLQERITQEIRSSLKPEQFFQIAVNQIGEAFNVDRCLVHIYVESPTPHIPLMAEYKRPGIEAPWVIDIPVIGNPHVVRLLSQDSAIACDDVEKEPLLKGALSLCQQVGLKSMMGVRTSYQGKPNGVIGVHQYHHPRHWRDEEISLLEAVAAQLGIAIAQANLLARERQRRIELDWHNQQLTEEIRIRQHTEEALRKSEERWQLVLEGNNDGIYDWNIKTGEVFLSSRLKEMLGYQDYELRNHVDTWHNLLHPEDFKQVIKSQEAYLNKQSPEYLVEYRLRCKDGSYKWILARGQAQWDEMGQPVRMVGSHQDISDRKQVEAALIQSEKKYRDLVEASQDMIWSVDNEGDYTFVNSAVKQIYGYNPEEMIGCPFAEFISPHQISKDEDIFHRVIQGKPIFQHETTHIARDGKPIHLMFNAIAQRDEWGEIVGTIGTASDITERKQREEALRLIVEGTASATGCDFMRSCVFYLAKVLQVRYALIAEVDKERTKARSLAFWIGETWGDNFEYKLEGTPCQGAVQGKACLYPENVQDLFPCDGDLTELDAESYLGIPLHNSDGSISGILVVMDVKPMVPNSGQESILKIFAARASAEIERQQADAALRESEARERKKAEELQFTLKQLKHTQAQLIQAEKMLSLGQFVAGVAHEINNPVNFIYGNITYADRYFQDLLSLIELYQQTYPNSTPAIQDRTEEIELDFLVEDWQKIIHSMQLGSERIQQIVVCLRNFSRLEESELKSVDIHDGIENTLMILRHRFRSVGDRCEIQVIKDYGKLPLITCYASQLNQVFLNLLNNAIDAVEKQPSPRIITIRTEMGSGFFGIGHGQEEGGNKNNFSSSPSPYSPPTPKNPLPTPSIIIRITDNGYGISEEVINRIFDPFFTTKSVGAGAGLGLSISYQIVVNRHGGKMKCNSVVGEGTEFVIELPIAPRKIS